MSKIFRIGQKNNEFLEKVIELSGENVLLCEQCGICTTSCPMVEEMDITPSQIMHIVKLGDEYVLQSETIWFCASCYTCTVRCPRGIDLSKVTEALRQIIIRKGTNKVDLIEIGEEEEDIPTIALVSVSRKFVG